MRSAILWPPINDYYKPFQVLKKTSMGSSYIISSFSIVCFLSFIHITRIKDIILVFVYLKNHWSWHQIQGPRDYGRFLTIDRQAWFRQTIVQDATCIKASFQNFGNVDMMLHFISEKTMERKGKERKGKSWKLIYNVYYCQEPFSAFSFPFPLHFFWALKQSLNCCLVAVKT